MPGPVTVKVPVVIVAGSIALLKVALIARLIGTVKAPLAGLVELTVPIVVSALVPVVNVHGFGASPPMVSVLPAKSLAPPVIVTVYAVLAARLIPGVKVAVVPA